MARFDPNHYPDRLAFEAHARRVRARELERLWAASKERLADLLRQLAHGAGSAVTKTAIHARRPVHH